MLIAVGFLGAFTTFSTFEADTLDLLTQERRAQAGLAFLNVAGSVGAGLLAVALGGATARLLSRSRPSCAVAMPLLKEAPSSMAS